MLDQGAHAICCSRACQSQQGTLQDQSTQESIVAMQMACCEQSSNYTLHIYSVHTPSWGSLAAPLVVICLVARSTTSPKVQEAGNSPAVIDHLSIIMTSALRACIWEDFPKGSVSLIA